MGKKKKIGKKKIRLTHPEINGISAKFNLTFERCKLIIYIYMEDSAEYLGGSTL